MTLVAGDPSRWNIKTTVWLSMLTLQSITGGNIEYHH